ncbi:MAG: hypothetical protein HZC42_01475 [Candidatus Eisenbacteria bacterium]|nr:hypothetical protein [Candidatus Eisenbacteria bacterium]
MPLTARPDTSPRPAPAPSADAPVEWSFNPWRERPARSALAAALGLAMCAALASLREPVLLTFALCLAALASLSPLLAPARCRVDEQGAARSGPFGRDRRAWREVRRAVRRRAGLLLSPHARPHWLDPWRALVLPFPLGESERLRSELEPRLARRGL